MINKSHYLSVLDNNWEHVPSAINEHKLNSKEVTQIAEQQPQIKQIKQRFPQVSAAIEERNIKKLSNGIYVGALNAQQKPHGYGIIRYNDGSTLHSKFVDGKANGKGLILYSKSQYYVGDFVDNHFDGRGQFHSPQITYVGQFRNNRFQGNGQLQMFKNNGIFVGIMQNGFMKEGILTWQVRNKKSSKQPLSKFEYKGKFKENKFQDNNAILISNSGIYRGSFKQGKKQGKGRFQFSEKYQYIGQYSNNQKSGFGTLYNPQVTKQSSNTKAPAQCQVSQLQKNISYRGQFKNNLPHGKGQVYQQQSKSLKQAQYIEGIWAQLIMGTNGVGGSNRSL